MIKVNLLPEKLRKEYRWVTVHRGGRFFRLLMAVRKV